MPVYDDYDCYELPETNTHTRLKPRVFVFPDQLGITMGDGNFNTTVLLTVEQTCALMNLLWSLEYIDPEAAAVQITDHGHTVVPPTEHELLDQVFGAGETAAQRPAADPVPRPGMHRGQPAGPAARAGRDGPRVWAAVHPQAAPGLRRPADPGL